MCVSTSLPRGGTSRYLVRGSLEASQSACIRKSRARKACNRSRQRVDNGFDGLRAADKSQALNGRARLFYQLSSPRPIVRDCGSASRSTDVAASATCCVTGSWRLYHAHRQATRRWTWNSWFREARPFDSGCLSSGFAALPGRGYEFRL